VKRFHLAFRVFPFLLLLLWFRFENFFHLYPFLPVVWLCFSFAMFFLLRKTLGGGFRALFLAFWAVISALVLVDFLQLIWYSKSSDSDVLTKIEESNREVQRRATSLLDLCRSSSREIESVLGQAASLSPGDLFIRLQQALVGKSYWWGVYSEDGQLLSWSGQVPYREGFLATGTEEVSVLNELHQQLLKHRRSVILQNRLFSITVLNPVAADYGIENRYLRGYNLFTDGLSIRPSLLYNSQQSTTTSADLIIRTLAITSEFSISVLYRKAQYSQFLIHRIFRLHWWLELLTLGFILITNILLFLSFWASAATTCPVRKRCSDGAYSC